MRLLRPYLWKEWHEQRTAVLGLLISLPLLVIGIASIPTLLGAPIQLSAVETGAAATFAALLAIGTGLLPEDSSIERRRFLERLPGGLAAAFRAKLVFFALSLEGAAAYGVLLGYGAAALTQGGSVAIEFDRFTLLYLLPAMGASLWTFAVSAWVPRGGLALPAAACWVMVLCWPVWVFYSRIEWVATLLWEPLVFFLLCLVGTAVTARVSFVNGLSREGSHTRAAFRGILVALPFLAPAWIWAGMQLFGS